MMTLEMLVNYVVDEFVDMMNEDGFGSFCEMRNSYKWTGEDVREQIGEIISMRDCRECMTDDEVSFVGYGGGCLIGYGEFKKLVMDEMKKRNMYRKGWGK